MKKIIILLIILIIIFLVLNNTKAEEVIIPDESIRLRVIANSNTVEDQNIKLKVRDIVQNKIYVRYDKAVEIKQKAATESENTEGMPFVRGATNSSDGIDSVVFYVDDPENIEEVIVYAEKTDIDLETYKLSANDKEYENMIKPIENVASFSKILVIIVIVAGAMIISLILLKMRWNV